MICIADSIVVAYSLIVVVRLRDHCVSPEKIKVVTKETFIASSDVVKSGCGFNDSPLILEAKPGQTIQIDMFDFSWSPDSSSHCKYNYGYVLDMQTDDVIKMCGGSQTRDKHLYSSMGHQVQVLFEGNVLESHRLLLAFKGLQSTESNFMINNCYFSVYYCIDI